MASGVKLLEGYVEVTAKADGAGLAAARQVGDEVEASPDADRAGRGFGKKLVGGIVGSIAVVKIGQFIGDSITAGSDLSETINKANTIFGSGAPAIQAWGDNAAKAVGLSKAAALEAAAGFGNMFTQLGFASDAAAGLSTSTVQMAADLGSFNNLPTADVTDRISAALRGEYDSLQALIPNINAARVEQEAMAATGKTNASELTAQEKAAATLAIITNDGAAAMGDFAKTNEGAANQQKIAAAQTEDLKASLGTALLPVIQEILGVVTTQFLPMLQDFAKFITENEQVIAPLAIGLGVLAAAIWVVNVAMYANPVGLIIAGIILLIGIIILLVTQWDTVVAFLTDVWNGFINWIVEVITGFVGWWNGIWAGFGGFISDVWNGFVSWIQGVWSGFINWIIGMIVGYLSFWIGVWTSVASFFSGIWQGIVSFAQGAINNLISFFTGLPGAIMGALSGAATWLLNVGRDIVAGLRSGIEGAWKNLVSWFSGLFGNIIDIAKRILGIASPSKVFKYEIGYMLPKGAEEGIELGMPSLNRTIANMIVPPEVDAGAYGVGNGPSYRGAGFGSQTVVHAPITIEESTDPLGSAGRVARELKKWKAA
jgi:hypothetical protein